MTPQTRPVSLGKAFASIVLSLQRGERTKSSLREGRGEDDGSASTEKGRVIAVKHHLASPPRLSGLDTAHQRHDRHATSLWEVYLTKLVANSGKSLLNVRNRVRLVLGASAFRVPAVDCRLRHHLLRRVCHSLRVSLGWFDTVMTKLAIILWGNLFSQGGGVGGPSTGSAHACWTFAKDSKSLLLAKLSII